MESWVHLTERQNVVAFRLGPSNIKLAFSCEITGKQFIGYPKSQVTDVESSGLCLGQHDRCIICRY